MEKTRSPLVSERRFPGFPGSMARRWPSGNGSVSGGGESGLDMMSGIKTASSYRRRWPKPPSQPVSVLYMISLTAGPRAFLQDAGQDRSLTCLEQTSAHRAREIPEYTEDYQPMHVLLSSADH